MKKVIYFILLAVAAIIVMLIYGYRSYIIYHTEKLFLDPIQIIQKETDIALPKGTKLVNHKFISDIGHAECLEIEIYTNAKQLKELLAFKHKYANLQGFTDLNENAINSDDIDYVVWMPFQVKWGIINPTYTQRETYVVALKPNESGNCKAFIQISKLGWSNTENAKP